MEKRRGGRGGGGGGLCRAIVSGRVRVRGRAVVGSVVKKTHVKLESSDDDLRCLLWGLYNHSGTRGRKEGQATLSTPSWRARQPYQPLHAASLASSSLSLSLASSALSLSAYPGLLAASQTTLGVSTDTSCTRRHTAKAACRSSSYSSRATPLCGKRRAGWWKLVFLPEY